MEPSDHSSNCFITGGVTKNLTRVGDFWRRLICTLVEHGIFSFSMSALFQMLNETWSEMCLSGSLPSQQQMISYANLKSTRNSSVAADSFAPGLFKHHQIRPWGYFQCSHKKVWRVTEQKIHKKFLEVAMRACEEGARTGRSIRASTS
jgi:hypothetical protein